ncbi:PDDEXK nuclease domain-containing protein [Selenomonas sp. AE3005]|uniref:PDDEXK nuclease domain-containing protein n=1 Tax=Selenomonas sp. AE3005 TaxID=1485543 RepID=UPI0025E9A250|nr:PDDEXK nuclease domain-containing protein [Selenomonas sp. AE3005]
MLINQADYLDTIHEIKATIKKAQYKATLKVNSELLLLYYHIGQAINRHKVWGNKFIENLSRDLRLEYPDAKGYSVRNLKYMAKFAETYPDKEFVQQVVAQIPWGHNVVIMDKVLTEDERTWYLKACAENGWSRNVLVHQIESNLYARQATADKISNFENRLPAQQSELATQMMKDPYIFDFIPFKADMLERDIEKAMVTDVTKLLLELGAGFAFLGNQYHLNVGGEDFYLDLLFYNLKLRCYVVIELKTGDFKPEYAGKLNFYLSAVDNILKTEQDAPTIGLLLCKSKNDLIAEYALRDINKPIGVSEYRITDEIPEKFRQQLPSIEDIKNRIGKTHIHKNL